MCNHDFIFYLGEQEGAGPLWNCSDCHTTLTLSAEELKQRIEVCPKCGEELDQLARRCACGYDGLLDFPLCEECGGAVCEGECQDCGRKSMRLHCMNCGKSVSSEIPVDVVVRAWIQCPECIDDEFHMARGANDYEQLNKRFSHQFKKGSRNETRKATTKRSKKND